MNVGEYEIDNVVSGFAKRCASAGVADRLAVRCGDDVLTYRELWRLVSRAAAQLIELGITKGDVVALAADPSPAYIAYTMATLTVGAVHFPLEPGGPDALTESLARSGAQLIVADVAARSRFADAAMGDTKVWRAEEPLPDRTGPTVEIGPDDGAVLLSTSGSTGKRKNISLTHQNVLANAAGVAERTSITPDDTLLNCMPLYHTNALNNQLFLPLLIGAGIALHRRFVPEKFFDSLQSEKPTYITGSPTMYRRLLPYPVPQGATSSLRFLRGGAAAFSEDLHAEVEKHFGAPLLVSWGLTEATCTSAMNPPGARRIGTVGTPLMGQDVAVLDFDDDIVLAPHSRGEIGISGPNVAPEFGPGWLRTGDIGSFDEAGYLSIVGRRKELILRGGENIYPQEVETVLLSHSDITQCCVVGVPSNDYGEVPVACVARRRHGPLSDADLRMQLLELATRKLPKYAVPAQLLLLDELPTIGVGKADRRTMKALATEFMASV